MLPACYYKYSMQVVQTPSTSECARDARPAGAGRGRALSRCGVKLQLLLHWTCVGCANVRSFDKLLHQVDGGDDVVGWNAVDGEGHGRDHGDGHDREALAGQEVCYHVRMRARCASRWRGTWESR